MKRLEDQILQFNPDTLQSVRKMYNFDKVEDVIKAVDILEEWVKKQDHFVKKDFSREYLERVIIIAKGSVERAKQRLDKLCTMRTLMPRFFEDCDVKNDFKPLNDIVTQVILPKMIENNRVLLIKTIGQKYDSAMCFDFLRTLFYYAEYQLSHDYLKGLIVVADCLEANIANLVMKLNVVDLQQCIVMMTNAYGVRIKGIHIISESKAIELLVSIMKQIFTQKIAQRIHVHNSIEELNKFLPKNMLPVEYGGKERSLETLKEEWLNRLSSKEFREYYKEITAAKTDESFRQRQV